MNLNQYATATGLAVNNIIKLPFLLPPLEIQKNIIQDIEPLLYCIDKIQKNIIDCIYSCYIQKQAILNKAFKGKLTRGFLNPITEIILPIGE